MNPPPIGKTPPFMTFAPPDNQPSHGRIAAAMGGWGGLNANRHGVVEENALWHRCFCPSRRRQYGRVREKRVQETMLSRLPQSRLDPSSPVRHRGGDMIGLDASRPVWDL
jgi:hypothetical protein